MTTLVTGWLAAYGGGTLGPAPTPTGTRPPRAEADAHALEVAAHADTHGGNAAAADKP